MCIIKINFVIFNYKLTLSLFKVWSLVLAKNDQYLITGCHDNELHIWRLSLAGKKTADISTNLDDLNIVDHAEISDIVYSFSI